MKVRTSLLAAITAGFLVLSVGCSPSADLSLRFEPDSSQRYLVTTDVIRDFRFEQPTMDKLREEQSQTLIAFGFTQDILSVNDAGVATALITIDDLSVYVTNKNDVRIRFNSADASDHDKPLAQLIGKQYTVDLSPQGNVVSFNTTEVRRAITAGLEARIADRMFNEDGITERHAIPALWDAGAATVNQTWTQVVGSPPGVLAPKNYLKTYTFAGIETRDGSEVAVVNMTGREDADPAATQLAGGMGMFAKMFDSSDDYTGTLLLSVEDGGVLAYDETLISTYIAQEMPANADPDKGPDTLTMRFTRRISMERR